MKSFILILLSIIITSCGACSLEPEIENRRSIKFMDGDWISAGKAHININRSSGFGAVSPIATNITYTEPEAGAFTLEPGTIAAMELDDDTLSLGTIEVQKIKINKLKICDPGGTTKCTEAIIIIYTTGSTAGFVNTTEGYGLDVYADNQAVGLTDANGALVASYTIPANDRKVTAGDFADIVYELEVDISNAGAGDYDMDLVVEILLGN